MSWGDCKIPHSTANPGQPSWDSHNKFALRLAPKHLSVLLMLFFCCLFFSPQWDCCWCLLLVGIFPSRVVFFSFPPQSALYPESRSRCAPLSASSSPYFSSETTRKFIMSEFQRDRFNINFPFALPVACYICKPVSLFVLCLISLLTNSSFFSVSSSLFTANIYGIM